MKRLLTIQDISCVGPCSTTVALPLVSACGVECSILPTCILSNHTGGFGSWTFCDLTGELPKIEAKWAEEDLKFDAFYTGYVAESHIGPILSIFESAAKPGAIRFVDPAMADNGVLYRGFSADFPTKMAKLAAVADYLLPNLTEAALLVGEPGDRYVKGGRSKREIESLVAKLHALGARNVVLTGVSFDDAELGSAVSDGRSVRYDFNRRRSRSSHGTGDVFASVFAGAVMRGMPAFEAAALAADIVCEAIEATDAGHWYGVSFEKVIPSLVRRLDAAGANVI